MKVLFHLKGGQQGELLLNLIFPDYPDGHGDDGENAHEMSENEKETDKSVSLSSGCAYTPVMVDCKSINPNVIAINEAYIVAEYPVPTKF